MDILLQLTVFAGKSVIVFAFIAAIAILIAILTARSSQHRELETKRLDKQFRNWKLQLSAFVRGQAPTRKERKAEKASAKKADLPATYVLDFKGDLKASAVEALREEIQAVLLARRPQDDVFLRLESPGGVVHGYGLAAAELLRLKKAGCPLTISVDKVAASGGYMMACTADRIVAAPFAILGSIGVVAQVPNVNRLLRKHDVDYKEYTAGEFKRTVSVFGEITSKGEAKFLEQLEDTHSLFKSFVRRNRPALNIDRVATGEYWYGEQCLELGLIDEIATSDERLLELSQSRQLVHLKFTRRQPLTEKLSGILGLAFHRGVQKSLDELEMRRFI